MRPSGTVLATPGMAAYLTWKQAEMLVILDEQPMSTRDISDLARALRDRDMADGLRPPYWGVDDSSINGCLQTLVRRGLVVRRHSDDLWCLTYKGREAAKAAR
jgi:hypothetical protein